MLTEQDQIEAERKLSEKDLNPTTKTTPPRPDPYKLEMVFGRIPAYLENEKEVIEQLRIGALKFARLIETLCPQSPERTLAWRALEQSLDNAIHAVERY